MTSTMWRPRTATAIAIVSALVPLLSALRGDHPQQPVPVGSEPADAFAEADLTFRSIYAGGRAATLAKLGLVIVVERDNLILIHSGRRTEVSVIPPVYHRLKAVSHIPLAIYVGLAPYGDVALDEERLGRLRSFRARVAGVWESLDRSGLSLDQCQRSRVLVERCRDFLDGVLATGRYDRAGLQALTRAAAPVVLANAGDAAQAQIEAYHAEVSVWRRQIAPGEWARLRVLVLGRQMERKHNVAVQYFAKLLGVTGESRRLVYAEELSGEHEGLNLLATHQLDSELSLAFFDDPERMEIDLLGNAASVYLDRFDFGR